MAYNKKVMDHFIHPRNAGEMLDADMTGKAANDVDGDIIVISLKVKDGIIIDAKHQVFGCAAAIAGASAFTEMIKGKTVEDAVKITKEDVSTYLDGVPESKIKCSILGPEAMQDALRKMPINNG
jgi:NifU-like protein involved in Fe-S cluster formation